MRAQLATAPALVARLEAHSVNAWPASVAERFDDGWVLRATPGLDRGRSNHALPPCRELSRAELDAPITRVEAFAARHGIGAGIQVSPLELQAELFDELCGRGWVPQGPVLVMTASAGAVIAGGDPLELVSCVSADPAWLDAWANCEARRDQDAHAGTVFPLMEGSAQFARFGRDAVGIAVESDEIVGLFCLAVAPHARRRGLGRALVRGLLASCHASAIAYLQVEQSNTAAVQMYERLGFEIAYTYRHCVRPHH